MSPKERQFARRKDVPAAAKGLMLAILSFKSGPTCRPTRAQLMESTGFAENTLDGHLRRLREAGALNTSQIRDSKGRVRVLYVPFPPMPDHGKSESGFGHKHADNPAQDGEPLPQLLG